MQRAVLLLLVAMILCHTCSTTSTVAPVYLSQPQPGNGTSFVQALLDSSVSHIIFVTNYTLSNELNHFRGRPLQIDRNISISGLGDTFPVLDLQWKRGKLLLCSTCVFTISNLVLANERQGVGPAYDFFIGRPGSVVQTFNILRLRLACIKTQQSEGVIRSTSRSVSLPGSSVAPQPSAVDATYQGRTYPGSLFDANYTSDVPFAVQEGESPAGGYALGEYNRTRLCLAFVTDECLDRMSSDACVAQLMDRMNASAAAAAQGGLSTAALAAAIAVPVAVGLLLSMAALLLLLRKRWRQQQQQQLAEAECGSKRGVDEGPAWGSSGSSRGHKAPGLNIMRGPLGGSKAGWELTASHTAPLLGNVGDSRIHFGDLVGSGGFGVVYKARWAGQQVAVKVIEHDTSAAAAVTNEIQLLLAFDHPNIVRALHYVTYTQTSTTTCSSSGKVPTIKTGGDSSSSSSGKVPTSSDIDDSSSKVPTSSGFGNSSSNSSTGALQSSNRQPILAAAAAAGCAVLARVGSRRRPSYDCSVGVPLPLHESACSSSGGSKGLQRRISGAESVVAAAPASAANGRGAGGDCVATFAAGKDQPCDFDDSKQQQQQHHHGSVKAETWLVTEFCDLGTLHHTVRLIHEADARPPGQLLSRQAKLRLLLLLQDAARGLQALHAQHTVHGDLNSRNVLVCSSPSSENGMVAKLADLGLSRVLQHHKTHRTTKTVGTMSHMAPEVLRCGRISAASDVYSFGIMVHTVFTGMEAFRTLHYGQFFQTVVLEGQRPPLSAAVPADVLMLMERCWAAEPADRPTAERLLELLGFLIQVRQQNLTPRIA